MWLFMPGAASSGVPAFCLKDAPIILSDIVLNPTGFGIDYSGASTIPGTC